MGAESNYGGAGVGYMDGTYLPVAEMRIPITDMGFQLSDMCYDAVHVRNGRFFRLDDHLDRWEQSISERRYDTLNHSRDQVGEVLHGCVARAELSDALITFVATRGSPASAHKDLRSCKNRFMVWAMPYYAAIEDAEVEQGCEIIVAKTVRIAPGSVDPTVKNFGRLDFVRALFEAYDRDARYAVLPDQDGHITEGRGWNIFVLKDGVLLSPDRCVLEGITRKTVLELSAKLNIECRLAEIPIEMLGRADEVFLTSTAGGSMPVCSVDHRAVGDGAPGPVTLRLKEMYWAMHEDPAYSVPVCYEIAEAL